MLAEKMINELNKNMLADGFNLIMDLEKSHNNIIYDSISDSEYTDVFTGFASIPISYNHPAMNNDDFIKMIGKGALVKVANSDIYTKEFVEAVITFRDYALPDYLKYMFFIDGGALAVENALKVAFDWKLKKTGKKEINKNQALKIIHFKEAFHGRSGYTLSLTNTTPEKTAGFPIFSWPRINNPKVTFPIDENIIAIEKEEKYAIKQIEEIVKKEADNIAGIIIEPIQCEGGDNHFRKEFLQEIQLIAQKNDILFIVDEVQTGMCVTGKVWAHQHFNLQPDIVCFGKKTQVCGILVGRRLDEVQNHVFRESSRISSTWGGNIVDYIRLKQYIKIIKEEDLLKNAEVQGNYILEKLFGLQKKFPSLISNVRGLGLIVALDLPNSMVRDKVINMLFARKVIFVPCGKKSVRFRPALDIRRDQINIIINLWEDVLKELELKEKRVLFA